jgi:hypothetical protein
MLRLLPKSELDKMKNSDKAREVAEGLKISRRVDGLRELAAAEESKLEKYRKETLEAIRKDIKELDGQKESLLSEVRTLRAEKESGMKDVLKAESENVAYAKILDVREKVLNKCFEDLEIKESEVKEMRKSAKNDLLRADANMEQANYLLQSAENDRIATNRALNDARMIGENAIAEKERVEAYLVVREAKVKAEEAEIIDKQKEIVVKEREISTEKSQLADQRATLERAIERLRKNRF